MNDATITFRLPAGEKRRLQEGATEAGMSLGDWIRREMGVIERRGEEEIPHGIFQGLKVIEVAGAPEGEAIMVTSAPRAKCFRCQRDARVGLKRECKECG